MSTCKDCACWVKAPPQPGPAVVGQLLKGDCHGAPPVAIVMQGKIAFGWPATDEDDWCGAFKAKSTPDAK